MTKDAIICARFSSLEQSKGYSLERQMKNGHVERNGWRVEAELKDEGKSVFHGGNRAEGTALHASRRSPFIAASRQGSLQRKFRPAFLATASFNRCLWSRLKLLTTR